MIITVLLVANKNLVIKNNRNDNDNIASYSNDNTNNEDKDLPKV